MGTIAVSVIRGWFALGMLAAVAFTSAAHATPVVMSGTISYSPPASNVTLHVDRIDNDSMTDRSGTLRLELWAFSTPHTGAAQTGYRLAYCPLFTLNANSFVLNVECSTPYVPPPPGIWYFTLFLTEYTAGPANDGFDPQEYVNFDNAVVIDNAVAPATAVAVEYYWAARDHYCAIIIS